MAEVDYNKAHLAAYLEALGETEDRLMEVHYIAVNEAVLEAFGPGEVSEEERKSVARDEPFIVNIDKAIDAIQDRLKVIRSKLADDGSDPPW